MTHTINHNTTWMIWADGTMAMLDEIEAGEYLFMSDDYCLATDQQVSDYMGDLDDEIDKAVIAHNEVSEEQIVVGPRLSHFGTAH